jgi:hypothetical protein
MKSTFLADEDESKGRVDSCHHSTQLQIILNTPPDWRIKGDFENLHNLQPEIRQSITPWARGNDYWERWHKYPHPDRLHNQIIAESVDPIAYHQHLSK